VKPLTTSLLFFAAALLAASWSFQSWKSANNDFAANNSRLDSCRNLAEQILVIAGPESKITVLNSGISAKVLEILGESLANNSAAKNLNPQTVSKEIDNSQLFLHTVTIPESGRFSLGGIVSFLGKTNDFGIVPLAIELRNANQPNSQIDAGFDAWNMSLFRFVYASDASEE